MKPWFSVSTATLEIAYLEWNPQGERVAILVHGWPDNARSWAGVAAALAARGYRVLAPALRGFAPTRFRDPATPRSGQLAALGRDLLDFIDALSLARPLLVGHDWGARAVANACGLRPGVAEQLVMLSVGYGTNDPREQRRAFARQMWNTWSPSDWYEEEAFEDACSAFEGPDWAEVVLHSYRHRWGFVAGDAAYDADEALLDPAPVLAVPTLVLHGAIDTCNHPASSAGKERFFTSASYQRELLDGVGHFPQREAPDEVARHILAFVDAH